MTGEWTVLHGEVVRGHGIASGRAPDSPYPQGSITLQRSHFAARGFDLGAVFDGTINVDIAPCRWRPINPPVTLEDVDWSDAIESETFSFIPCRLRISGTTAGHEGFVYRPHPETKPGHHQPESVLELLMPWIDGIAPGTRVEVRLPAAHVELH